MTISVRPLVQRLWRAALLLALVVILAGLIAPLINATAFSGHIQRALQASLGRAVTFSDARFTLFSGPGFSLENVTIGEDPRYGLEPFGQVPVLKARIRLDKLLLGHIVFSSLDLIDPSLNVVKNEGGSWNIAELMKRLKPGALPVDVFPAFEISGGRINLKLGTRKTTLYVADADLSIYPQSSGKLYVRFSGSPARTDRPGNGFGRLQGTANWYLKPASAQANQLESDITLEPSHLSDITTLFHGEDIGVHGTVGAHARIAGPASHLQMEGELRLEDIHRWDLLPTAGEQWQVRYKGAIDLNHHHLELETVAPRTGDKTPLGIQVVANDFFVRPQWEIIALMNGVRIPSALPLANRLGLGFPEAVHLQGTMEGAISYSNLSKWSGGVSLKDVVAQSLAAEPLRIPQMVATLSADSIHFEPAAVETPVPGTLQVGGDYRLADRRVSVSMEASSLPSDTLKTTLRAALEMPAFFQDMRSGEITGRIGYMQREAEAPVWSGQFRFAAANLALPGFAAPITAARGHVSLSDSRLDLDHFAGTFGKRAVTATYHYNANAKHPEQLQIQMPACDLSELQTELDPTLREHGFLARLGMTKRVVPEWLAARNLQADLVIDRLLIAGSNMGTLRSHLLWQGTAVRFEYLELTLAEGLLRGHGAMTVAGTAPRYDFDVAATDYPWKGGFLDAEGQIQTFGLGSDALQNLQAEGTFTGTDLDLGADDLFSKMTGRFALSMANGWPDLHLSEVEASQGDESWMGAAASQSDGRLVMDLQHAGRQRHVVSTLAPETSAVSSALTHRGSFE